jgi:hypothetical protein
MSGNQARPTVEDEAANAMRSLFLQFNEQVKPFHEWLDGQRNHFRSQGYTDDEARAMAAAEFVTVFGSCIQRGSGV